jgi:hypothetical protein
MARKFIALACAAQAGNPNGSGGDRRALRAGYQRDRSSNPVCGIMVATIAKTANITLRSSI